MQNPQEHLRRLDFRCALVIEEVDTLRISVTELLRKQGWLAHPIKQAEQAFKILAYIPYKLIVIDSELPGICGMDFVRILNDSREWGAIQLVVITRTQSADFATEVAECGAFLARASRWEEDLCRFLSAYSEDLTREECLQLARR
jgi:DNA-binding response OmpR family regulator